MILAFGVSVLVLGEVFVRYHLQKLAGRLNRILDGMAKVMEGDLAVRIPADKNGDELDVISGCFNEMCESLDEHIRKRYLAEIEQKDAEMAALQSQINPHFLYNALDSITWMIEGEQNDDAVFMVSQLAKLFRISLSKGRTIITVSDELKHAQSYMNIQRIRYKNSFSFVMDVDADVGSYCTVKLILQPILENAINYGVGGMDEDDGGEIRVTGRLQDGTVILAVADNGLGMPKEEAASLLTDNNRLHKHGSGVGLMNINNRIKLLFGTEYGLLVESEPDEGTVVSICIPAVPFTEENRKKLEEGL